MSKNTVDGKKINRPADYEAFDYKNKNQVARTSQVGKGKDEKGIDTGFTLKGLLGPLYEQVRNYKENGKPFEDVVIVKAENITQEQNAKTNKQVKSTSTKRDEDITH